MKKPARAIAASTSAKRRKTAGRPASAKPRRSRTPAKARKPAKAQKTARARKAAKPRKPALSGATTSRDGKGTVRNLRSQLAAARRRIAELEAAADTDFLLGIPNRRGFERELQRAIAYMQRYRASGALLVLDVDRLKPINDAFGHAAGDDVLKTIAATLTRQVRSSDVVGRLGGDEFALLLWNLSETDARSKASAFEQAIDELSFSFAGRSVRAGASAGIALLGPQSEARRALEDADAAMYVRKAQRRHESGRAPT